jgi:hypothetical protein
MCGDSHLQPALTDASGYKDGPALRFVLSEEYIEAHMHVFTFILSLDFFYVYMLSRYSDGYKLDGRGSIPGRNKRVFLYSTAPRPILGPTQLPIQWVSRALCLRVNRPGREANHLSASSAEENSRYTSTPPYVFKA